MIPAEQGNKNMCGSQMADLTLRQAAELVRKKTVSPVELTRACLERIEELNPVLNVFITVISEKALDAAREAEAEIQRGGWRGPLHGIPIALKDLVDTAGVRTTAGSAVHQNRVPEEDAEVVRRLKLAGAVMIGKTNLHEFAYGGSSIISHFGAVRNPRDPKHIAGGSSGGSAAAVACGMCFGAIGTDTAGSIREPAALCGVVGLKPAYGRVSTRGVIPLAWSYDHVGPLARTVEDAALMLEAIAGFDPRDIFSRELPSCDYVRALQSDVRALRVGVPRELFFDDLGADVEAAMNLALTRIENLTRNVRDVILLLEKDRAVANCESYAFHERYVADQSELYQPSTLARILTGKKVTAPEYIAGKHELARIRRSAREIFADVDVLITPTTPVCAPSIAELEADPDNLRRREMVLLRNTRPFNVLGVPAISIPCATTGLPVGVQMAAAPGREDQVIALAHALSM